MITRSSFMWSLFVISSSMPIMSHVITLHMDSPYDRCSKPMIVPWWLSRFTTSLLLIMQSHIWCSSMFVTTFATCGLLLHIMVSHTITLIATWWCSPVIVRPSMVILLTITWVLHGHELLQTSSCDSMHDWLVYPIPLPLVLQSHVILIISPCTHMWWLSYPPAITCDAYHIPLQSLVIFIIFPCNHVWSFFVFLKSCRIHVTIITR